MVVKLDTKVTSWTMKSSRRPYYIATLTERQFVLWIGSFFFFDVHKLFFVKEFGGIGLIIADRFGKFFFVLVFDNILFLRVGISFAQLWN